MRRLAMLTLFAALSQAMGCAYFKATPPLQPQPVDKQVAADLPIPQGFEMDRSQSFKHKRSTFRRYQLVYRQDEYLGEDQVRAFLHTYFPDKGWEIAFVYGLEASKFIFWRDAEECRIEVKEDFGDRFTEMKVEVGPRKTPEGGFVARSEWTPTSTPASSPRK